MEAASLKKEKKYAEYAVVSLDSVLEVHALAPGTSAQKAEFITLMHAFLLAAEKTVNIHTDSKYAFTTFHVHGAIYKERGLISSGGKDIKYGQEILELLEAMWAPKKVAVMHCPWLQKGKSAVALENRRTDQEARAAALQAPPALPVAVTAALLPTPLTECVPHYSSLECQWFTQDEGKYCRGRWYQLADGRIVIPETLIPTFIKNAHQDSYMGKLALEQLLSQYFYVPCLTNLASNICKQCETCAKNNPKQRPLPKPGVQNVCSSSLKTWK
jgi:ribonuclease HI